MQAALALRALRDEMKWTRVDMASMLGLSKKAVESYELGWREIPDRVWKQIITVAAIQRKYPMGTRPCWELTDCPEELQATCLCHRITDGRFCWMTATKCCRQIHLGGESGFLHCLECPVVHQFLRLDPAVFESGEPPRPA